MPFQPKRNFRSEKSKLYRDAVKALQALQEAEGTNEALSAYADATWAQKRDDWAAARGVKATSGDTCINRLVTGRCNHHGPDWQQRRQEVPHTLPGGDHDTLWIKGGKPFLYLAQPYHLDFETTRGLVGMCADLNLRFTISAYPSFHFPGSVISIEITPAAAAAVPDSPSNSPWRLTPWAPDFKKPEWPDETE